jgi:hypothetical protein
VLGKGTYLFAWMIEGTRYIKRNRDIRQKWSLEKEKKFYVGNHKVKLLLNNTETDMEETSLNP